MFSSTFSNFIPHSCPHTFLSLLPPVFPLTTWAQIPLPQIPLPQIHSINLLNSSTMLNTYIIFLFYGHNFFTFYHMQHFLTFVRLIIVEFLPDTIYEWDTNKSHTNSFKSACLNLTPINLPLIYVFYFRIINTANLLFQDEQATMRFQVGRISRFLPSFFPTHV